MSLTDEERRLLGGSDLAAILGLSPYRTPLQVYARIVADAQQDDSAQLRRGRHLESAVLRLYEDETGATVSGPVKLRHLRLSYGRASLDALAVRGGRRVAEVKTAGISEVRHWGDAGTDQIPQHYLYQVAWYAGVALAHGVVDTGEVDVAALVAGDLRVYHVPYDAELFEMLEGAVARFWLEHVEPRRPPPISEPMKDLSAVAVLHPRHVSDARHWDTLAPPERVAVLEYLQAKKEEKEAQERRAAWEARAKLALAGASGLMGLPEHTGTKRIDWRQNRQTQAVDWEAVAAELGSLSDASVRALIKQHTTTTPGARPFVARPMKEQA